MTIEFDPKTFLVGKRAVYLRNMQVLIIAYTIEFIASVIFEWPAFITKGAATTASRLFVNCLCNQSLRKYILGDLHDFINYVECGLKRSWRVDAGIYVTLLNANYVLQIKI